MDQAFAGLRTDARNNNRGLTDTCEALVAGTITVDAITVAGASTTSTTANLRSRTRGFITTQPTRGLNTQADRSSTPDHAIAV